MILVVGEHRTICERHQEILPLEPEALEAVAPALDRAQFLLVDGRMPEAQTHAARRVRAAGGRVMLDAGHRRPGAEALIPEVDVAVLSHTYPDPGTDLDTFVRGLADRMAPDGLRIAGLTLGRDGCLLHSPETGPIRLPGHDVSARDTTGAGDVFHAGLAEALMEGMDVEPAARFANAAAALKCAGKTSRAPLPGKDDVRRLAGRS